MQTLIDNADDRLMEWLIDDTKDAKRAPEVAAWLVCGPLPLTEIISMRNERMRSEGASQDHADIYAPASVLYDLGRVAGLAGPVEYVHGMLWLKESHHQVILDWIRAEQFRRAGLVDDSRQAVA
ncbi:hypothetical protein [Agromyces sp. C10]|uniref:hypothetical protein n=1 Tax=Agromyces sp. C10 TaxID=2935077 RepID=UPI00200AC16E|nr:hypothetical protein [Agromyces sp. C10]MCK8608877.1 hypothetical protein [Agromyces sp. C10]